MPGGIQADPPSSSVSGANIFTSNPGFESGSTGWSLGAGWSLDINPANARTGSNSMKLDATVGTGALIYTAGIAHPATRYMRFSMWIKASADYNGKLSTDVFLHNAVVAGQAAADFIVPTTSYQQYTAFVAAGELHTGEAFQPRITIRNAPTAGQLWVDDWEAVGFDFPYEVWVPERWWGYVWEDDPQTVTVQVDLVAAGLQDALVDLELVLQVIDAVTPSTVYLTQTLGSLIDGGQTATFDFNQIVIGTSTLLKNTLRRKVGGATAKLRDGVTNATFPDWKLIRERVSVRESIPSYIDYATHAACLKHATGNHRKRIVWGLYSWWNGNFITGNAIPATVQANYDNLAGIREYSTQPVPLSWEAWRRCGVNAWHDYVSMQGADPRAGTDQITPAINSLKAKGIFYSQHTREYYHGRFNEPSWFVAQATNQDGWTAWAQRVSSQVGSLGWYALDEPSDAELTTALTQYRGIRDNATGGISWGVGIGPSAILDVRYRYTTDVAAVDPYPGGGQDANNGHFQTTRPKHPITWVAGRQLELSTSANGQRPYWLVCQAFNFVSFGMPAYKDVFMQSVAGLITGCKGFLWWTQGNVRGLQNYAGGGMDSNRQDTGYDTNGVGTSFSGDLSLMVNEGRFTVGQNRVSLDSPRMVRFAVGATVVAEVQSWTQASNGTLSLVGFALNCTGGTIHPDTGAWTLTFSAAPAANNINIAYIKVTDSSWQDFAACTRKIMGLESVWIQNRNNALVSSVATAGTAVKFAAWQHPADPLETVVLVANLLNGETPSITVTLATAAPVGAVVDVWGRGASQADQASLALDGTRTQWSDTLGAAEGVIYIVRRSSGRLRQATDRVLTTAGLGAL